ncbi:hypothetical protein Tco_1338043 [Tanacetum coccineum]
MQGTSLTKQERECKLYDAFDKFTHIKGESLHKYYLRFTQLINDMNIYNMKIEQFQVNTKFLNNLPPEWSKFVTDVKLVKYLHTTNFDQLHAYLEQHELYANEVRLLRERNQDPLAFFVVYVFSPADDPIACLNKTMAFLTVIASLRFPSTNNQLRTSSNLRNQATIQDGRVTMQQVQGRKGQSYSGHMARQCTQLKRPRNAAWYKDKAMLAEAQKAGQILDEEQLVFLADPGVPDGQVNAKAVLMANISNYGSDVISEVPHSKTYLNDMENQSVNVISEAQKDSMILYVIEQTSEQMINHVNNWEKANKEQNSESVTAELKRYKERVKTSEQCLNIDLSSREKMIDSQMDDMIKEKLALKEQVYSLEQNLSKQVKEKECLLQTFTFFKRESKEKEDKYMENEIDLEKKIKELDNIIFKVGQSAQTVHMLTKLQALFDNIHKQALGYQNPFHLKKAQQIKPTLYDGIVISAKHVAMHVIDDEETLILEEESRSKVSEK